MIKRYRFRKLLAPTAGFRNAVGMAALGLLIFAIGSGLSFQRLVRPLLDQVEIGARRVLSLIVPPAELDNATWLMGGACLLLGFYLEACIGMVGFWFLEVTSLLFVYMLFSFFLSGHMFPLDMLPQPWGDIVVEKELHPWTTRVCCSRSAA